MNKKCVTRKDFLKYEEVRKTGKYRMLFEEGRIATGLDEDVYMAIRIHYRECASIAEKFPNREILLNHV